VAVLIVLIAAGLYIPKIRKASAAGEGTVATERQAPPPSQPQPTASQPSAQPAETKAVETAPPSAPEKVLAAKKDAPKLMAKNAGGQAPDAGAAAAAAAAAKANKEELDKLEHEIDQLTSRSAAVNASLTTLQRQQATSGYGLRGDMVARQASMNLNLSKAQEAITHNDAERARRYTEKATADIEALEKFLGR
jgi:cell division protein FtsB